MDFRLTPDQDALVSAVDKLAAQFAAKPTDFHGFALIGEDLERELDEGQYFDIALVPELGPLSAAMAVERLARLPYTAEIALSMLVRPQLSGEWPRPLALVEYGRPGRFVATAKTILRHRRRQHRHRPTFARGARACGVSLRLSDGQTETGGDDDATLRQ